MAFSRPIVLLVSWFVVDARATSNSTGMNQPRLRGRSRDIAPGTHEYIIDWIKFYSISYSDGFGFLSQTPAWEDNFADSDCLDGKPNPNCWAYESGQPRQNNDEAQTYTDSKDNAFCKDGSLVLRALCSDGKNCVDVTCSPDAPDACHRPMGAITSASVSTKYVGGYGRWSARVKVGGELEGSIGKGLWPAFWFMGDNYDPVGWPECGEVDTMEFSSWRSTVGQNAYFKNNPYTPQTVDLLTTETPISHIVPMDSDGFRVYTLEHGQDENGHAHLKMWIISTYKETLDPGVKAHVEYPKEGTPDEMLKDFDASFIGKKMHAKLNLAVGGNLGGPGPYF
jgi:hypothetical protein